MKKPAIIVIAFVIIIAIIAITLLGIGKHRDGYYLRVDDQKYALCQSMLDDTIEPLASYQTVEDQDYVEVVTIPRYDWDEARIPVEVLSWEAEGYSCYPSVSEFNDDYSFQTILWECEIPFADYAYLDPAYTEIAKTFESGRYTCGTVPCLTSDGSNNELILCTLEK